MKIVIYATHSFGTYDTLSKHPDVIVLGFGTKWQGFIEKARVIRDYLYTLPDDEIVVIIDGFDSIIKNTENVESLFKSMNCNVLVSQDNQLGGIPIFISKYIKQKTFGTCKDDKIANSGLCIGYVKYLKIIFNYLIEGESTDDQRNFNSACSSFPFLKVDTENIIFENCQDDNQVDISNAHFCQTPGKISFTRVKRALQEYPQFFILEIILICLILYGIYIWRR